MCRYSLSLEECKSPCLCLLDDIIGELIVTGERERESTDSRRVGDNLNFKYVVSFLGTQPVCVCP